MATIRRLGVTGWDRATRDAYHRYRRRRQREVAAGEPVDPDRLAEHDLLSPDPQTILEVVLAEAGGEIAGAAMVYIPRPGSPGYESNAGIVWFDLHVLGDHRRRRLGTALARAVLDITDRHGCRTIGTSTVDADGEAAAAAFGLRCRSRQRFKRLDLAGLDWARIESWAAGGVARSPERRLEIHADGPPRGIWPEYCPSMTELFNSIPWDDVEHGDIVFTPAVLEAQAARFTAGGGRLASLLVREADGRITGLTEVACWDDQPEHAWQWLTAVHSSVQRNGIGRWMKAAMLLYLRERRPATRWMLTDNSSTNAGMLKINEELGFETYRVAGEYQASRQTFAAEVARRS